MESSNFYQLQQQQLGSYSSLAAQSTHGLAAISDWNPSLYLNMEDYNHYMNEILPNSIGLVTKKASFPGMGCDERSPNPSSTNSIQIINAVYLNENLGLMSSSTNNEQLAVYKDDHYLSERQLYSSSTSTKEIISWAASYSSCSSNDCMSAASSNLGLMSTSSLHHSTRFLPIDFMRSYGDENFTSTTRSPAEYSLLSCYHDRIRIHNQDSSYTQSSSPSNKTFECRNKGISRTKRVSTSSQRRPFHDEAAKKQRAVSQSSCPLPKVGKEKIGDRIAALHRLVAPFGKTDAASVLTEAIGYIQFLQHQIQTLSMPNCITPSHSNRGRCFQGVLSKQDEKDVEAKQDLRSRRLCIVPLSIASYISSSCAGLDGI